MQFSICSYSFHRDFASGAMDMFSYIAWCKETGMSQLDPWNRHLTNSPELHANLYMPWDHRMGDGGEDKPFLAKIKHAAAQAGLPFGCIAVDGAHIYEPTTEGRAATRAAALKWLDVAAYLGAKQIRVDAGGPDEMPDAALAIIAEGYADLIARGRTAGVEILIENHWGPSKFPANVVKILKTIPELGYLFDTNNWAPGIQEDAWAICAPYAKLTHFKAFYFDNTGNDPTVDLHKAFTLLHKAGYAGPWGIESCPEEVGERDAHGADARAAQA